MMWLLLAYLIVVLSAALYLCSINAARKKTTAADSFTDKVDALLPQTQCGECGYAGCKPYAAAIVASAVDINRCAPGGLKTMRALAKLTGSPTLPMAKPAAPASYAVIEEKACIGCVKCIKACPVDAIIGAAGQMHSIIPQYCTGCGLCLDPCPVDCIRLQSH